jgi:DNA (cytosine-5)-methyltransferase 1
MVEHVCEKCEKVFKQKSQLDAHKNRKNPCKKDGAIEKIVEQKVQEVLAKLNIVPAPPPPTPAPLKFIDLFCGIGSFHYSFKKLGWECVMSCDINEAARNSYQENYGVTPLGDVVEIDPSSVPDYDVICAGFPCQPFSQCGFHKGFDDERGTMFFQIMKFVDAKKPKIVILENVRALLAHDKGNTFKRISEELVAADYVLTHKVLTCSDYGLPQMRKRLFIVAVSSNDPLATSVDNILDLDEYKKKTNLAEFLGRNFAKDVAYTIRCGGKGSPIDDRHNWDGYYVDGQEYRLTIEDSLKLQGFDPEFKLCGTERDKWHQLGNTIPTVFTDIIGKNIQKYMQGK